VNRTSAGVSGPEVVAVNLGRGAPVTRPVEDRRDLLSACVGDAATLPRDAPFDTPTEGGAVDGASTGAGPLAAPQALTIARNTSIRRTAQLGDPTNSHLHAPDTRLWPLTVTPGRV
jgi:hypothetical protein